METAASRSNRITREHCIVLLHLDALHNVSPQILPCLSQPGLQIRRRRGKEVRRDSCCTFLAGLCRDVDRQQRAQTHTAPRAGSFKTAQRCQNIWVSVEKQSQTAKEKKGHRVFAFHSLDCAFSSQTNSLCLSHSRAFLTATSNRIITPHLVFLIALLSIWQILCSAL